MVARHRLNDEVRSIRSRVARPEATLDGQAAPTSPRSADRPRGDLRGLVGGGRSVRLHDDEAGAGGPAGAAHRRRPRPRRIRQIWPRGRPCRGLPWRARPPPVAGARAARGNRPLPRPGRPGAPRGAAPNRATPLISRRSAKTAPRESRPPHNPPSPRDRRRSRSIFGTNVSCSDAAASAWLCGSAARSVRVPRPCRTGSAMFCTERARGLEPGMGTTACAGRVVLPLPGNGERERSASGGSLTLKAKRTGDRR